MSCNTLFRRIASVLSGVLLSLFLSVGVFADSSELTFSESVDGYSYLFPDGKGIHSTSPLAETIGVVWVAADEGVGVVVDCNGEQEAFAGGQLLSKSGVYRIYIISGDYTAELNFEVVSEENSFVDRALAPSPDEAGNLSEDGITVGAFDGEIINYPFRFSAEGYMVTAMRDEQTVSVPENCVFAEDGRYSFTFTKSDVGTTVYRLSFTIQTAPSNKAEFFYPPVGFELTECTLDGEAYPFGEFVSMDVDGEYRFYYSKEGVSRSTAVIRDMVRPELLFNGTTSLTFDEGVSISCNEPFELSVMKDGLSYNVQNNMLMGAGVYRVNATDGAGNVATARVTIRAVSALNPISIAVVGAILLAAAVIYFFYCKRHLAKVR